MYNDKLQNGEIKNIGKIINNKVTYNVLGGISGGGPYTGLVSFDSANGVCCAITDLGFLGCATKEIANHLGIYFGMLVIEAMYGDIEDIKFK